MKIAELENPPQWLLDAKTDQADVIIVSGKVIWQGGTWLDGTWQDGTWQDGIWLGGTWRYGTWLGGTWMGGTWMGGIWQSGMVGSYPSTAAPIVITGLQWPVIYGSDALTIGCQQHTFAQWATFSDDKIADMHSDALAFWRRYKTFLLWSGMAQGKENL